MFVTLEDDTANMHIIIRPNIFEVYQRIVLGKNMLDMKDVLQKEGEVVHLMDKEIYDLWKILADVAN